MGWKIEFATSVEKELRKLGPEATRRILRFLDERIATADDPRSLGEPLHGPELGRFWKYRVGQYRIIASIQDGELLVVIILVRHRGAVYR